MTVRPENHLLYAPRTSSVVKAIHNIQDCTPREPKGKKENNYFDDFFQLIAIFNRS